MASNILSGIPNDLRLMVYRELVISFYKLVKEEYYQKFTKSWLNVGQYFKLQYGNYIMDRNPRHNGMCWAYIHNFKANKRLMIFLPERYITTPRRWLI